MDAFSGKPRNLALFPKNYFPTYKLSLYMFCVVVILKRLKNKCWLLIVSMYRIIDPSPSGEQKSSRHKYSKTISGLKKDFLKTLVSQAHYRVNFFPFQYFAGYALHLHVFFCFYTLFKHKKTLLNINVCVMCIFLEKKWGRIHTVDAT